MRRATRAATCLAIATTVITTTPAFSAPEPRVPDGMTASYLVADADSGEVELGKGEHEQYRSASIVKLLLAIDYLENLGPGTDLPEEDEALLEPMLRSSNDDAASVFWVRGGQARIIERMVEKIGLEDTAPPPADHPGVWGYTAISAADVAKTYDYLLEEAAPQIRRFVLRNLDEHTRCAADGFDQSFGIPSAVEGGAAVKQGWSGFGSGPAPGQECQESDDPELTRSVLNSPEAVQARSVASREAAAPAPRSRTSDLDLTRRAMHTTGLVDGHDKIIAVLTLEPEDTDWNTSAQRITGLTRALDEATS